MNKSLLAVLNDAERLLVAQTGRAELAALDEDAAIELEARIRRARNKYVGQYRRSASAAVAEHGGRGKARPENTRAAMKAEAFEESLSRVSGRVATLARQSAAELRAERIAAARAAKQGQGPDGRRAAPAANPKGRRLPKSRPVTAPCERPTWKSAGPARARQVPVSRRSGTANRARITAALVLLSSSRQPWARGSVPAVPSQHAAGTRLATAGPLSTAGPSAGSSRRR